jgi:hypothetical protein
MGNPPLAAKTNGAPEHGRVSIYVEIEIRAAMEDVWARTQDPNEHVRWDLRFTDIAYLPRPNEAEPQRFTYATRLAFGLKIEGTGETIGERNSLDGSRASALKFWSDDVKSLITEGAGYWRYVPTPNGVRFLTSYDYRVRYGFVGRIFDMLVFKPLMGWATAWSFDRLRLWLERGTTPEDSLRFAIVGAVSRIAVGAVWLYQGLVPKIILRHPDELAMLTDAGVPAATAMMTATTVGWLEVAMGLAVIFFSNRWLLVATVLLMMGATLGVAFHSPRYLGAAFNPVSLNLLMAALAFVGIVAGERAPSAGRCKRRPSEGKA